MDESRLNALDGRIGRMESQMATLAGSMERFADSMTALVRVDERVAQLLTENRNLGQRLGRLQQTVQTLQLENAAMRVIVNSLESTSKESKRWIGQYIFYVFSLLTMAVLASRGGIPGL